MENEQDEAAAEAKDRMDALTLMKGDMQQYMRLYSYLSQMIDYGHTGVEKRYWFYRLSCPFARFRKGGKTEVDLSQVTLTAPCSARTEAGSDELWAVAMLNR